MVSKMGLMHKRNLYNILLMHLGKTGTVKINPVATMDAMMCSHVTLPCSVVVYRIASNQHAMTIAGIAWRLGLHPETCSDTITMQVRPRCSFVLTSDL